MNFCICTGGNPCRIIVEKKAYEGVKRISDTLAGDIECVCGFKPSVIVGPVEKLSGYTIIAATLSSSPLLDGLMDKRLFDDLKGKRECYGFYMLDAQDLGIGEGKVLLVAGSDKRGTIYGLLNISERCGVSPLIYWGDVMPAHRDDIVIDIPERFVSKEPSVEYRGLFINDELPGFGNWAFEKFGGVNASVYEEVFKLILRLKGNYLWPAMWFAVFSEDGPGLANAELADIYGIVMGTSHHEPLCRAGAEWQKIYDRYGTDNTWSFIKNAEAISRFWKDGLIRNRGFENIYTIGMRGEDDSLLLPENASLEDNINVIKKAVREQQKLLRENVSPDLKGITQMLAIYKEVEDYYYGDANTPGLKDWEALEDVIFLLSDDNFGNTRGLPTEADRSHSGGFGMYYHFDYHGAPISYECADSVTLPKIWDQMTLAYESGVRKLWIVNVGDIKLNEFPLSYFMDLAYDYEKWSVPNLTDRYAKEFMDKCFGNDVSKEKKDDILKFVNSFTGLNAMVHPETMRSDTFAPTAFCESERMIDLCKETADLGEQIRMSLCKEAKTAFESMFYYQGIVSLYSKLAGLYGGMNSFLAARGCLRANSFIPLIEEMIDKDRSAVKEFHEFNGGKWVYMLSSAHIGFGNWNDDIWKYPCATKVYPLDRKAVVISFEDGAHFHTGSVWTDSKKLESFVLADSDQSETRLFIDMKAPYGFDYRILCDDPNIRISPGSGSLEPSVQDHLEIKISADRKAIPGTGCAGIRIELDFGEKKMPFDNTVINDTVYVHYAPLGNERELFIHKSVSGVTVIPAGSYASMTETESGCYVLVKGLGIESDAVKTSPYTKSFVDCDEKPYLEYLFKTDVSGDYSIDFYTMGRNPVVAGNEMSFDASVDDAEPVRLKCCQRSYKTHYSDPLWCSNVLTGINVVSMTAALKKGDNSLKVFAGDPNIEIEKIVVYPAGLKPPYTRLGPCNTKESLR